MHVWSWGLTGGEKALGILETIQENPPVRDSGSVREIKRRRREIGTYLLKIDHGATELSSTPY